MTVRSLYEKSEKNKQNKEMLKFEKKRKKTLQVEHINVY